ncbi:MAG: hypothetical protein R3Y62_01635 [Eubacteriales bacterium]
MKNLNYFPFARGRYFYGKLLAVDDFETEQRYMNDKRRLVNRFLHGTGVVCGMNVIRVDDRTISVEMGMALDFAGREVVVDAPLIRKLDMVDGYDETVAQDGYFYLCIEYAEKGTEPVHSIAGGTTNGEAEYNKYAEGYRLFLTTQEPEHEGFTVKNYYQDTKTIYWGNGIRVKQSLPRFVTANGDCQLTVTVENMGQQQGFVLDYDLSLTCLQHEGSDKLHIHFDEGNFARAGRYQLTYDLKAMDVTQAEGSVNPLADSLALTIDGRAVTGNASGSNRCTMVSGDPKNAVMNRYYKSAMEDIVRNTYQQSIYLAKISLIQGGSAYYMEDVEPMPFDQYVYNNALALAMHQMGGQGSAGGAVAESTAPIRHRPAEKTIASGSFLVDMGIGGVEGQRFFSEAVSHGLGLGAVSIQAGIGVTTDDDAPVVFGSSQIFDQEENEVQAELAVKTDVTRGTFRVGLRLTGVCTCRQVRVHWTAVRDVKDTIYDQNRRKMFLRPDVCSLKVREEQYFEVVFENLSDRRIQWRVHEPQGGEIDQNGRYIAPSVAGVYQVIAQSMAHPELTASTYVVVRD